MPKNMNDKTHKRFPTWLKRTLLVLGALILLGGSYVVYLLKFKEYDIADSEVTEITRETYKIQMPDGSTIELDEEGDIVESSDSGTSVADSSSGNVSTGSGESDDSSSTDGTTDSESGTTTNESSSSSNGGNTSGNGSTSTNGNSGDSSGNGNSSTNEGSTGTDGSTNNNGSANGGSTPPPSSDDRVTVASIKDNYQPVLTSLQSQATSRLDALVGRAIAEYQTKKANGESISYGYFYNKYSTAASELEGRTDKVFYQVISIIEKDLERNGFSKLHAQSFVSEYEKTKQAQRDALLSKAIGR